MKTFFILTFSFFFLHILMPQEQKTGTITLTVTSLENSKGQVRAALYNKAEGFPSDNSMVYKAVSAAAEKPKTTLVFEDIPYGTYAIAVLHDENENGELDTNLVGYPQEGYGASNNKLSTFSAPTFEESHFQLQEEDKRLLISLRN